MGQVFTLADLKRILRAAAGEAADLDAEIEDVTFAQLGYESLALLETGLRIEREYGVTLDDEVFGPASNPGALVDAVNARLAANAA